jgi:hypothetical protein
VAATPLAANDKITVTFPTAATYRLSGDEFAGVQTVDQASSASGTAGTFSSGTALAGSGNEVAFGAVSVPAGSSSPTWATDWNPVGAYTLSTQYLGKAYQLPPAGGYAATGSASGAWLAAVVTFR